MALRAQSINLYQNLWLKFILIYITAAYDDWHECTIEGGSFTADGALADGDGTNVHSIMSRRAAFLHNNCNNVSLRDFM